MEPVDEDCVGRAVGTPEETLQQYEELAFRNGSSCRISMELNINLTLECAQGRRRRGRVLVYISIFFCNLIWKKIFINDLNWYYKYIKPINLLVLQVY